MSRFFIGQRVRKVAFSGCNLPPELVVPLGAEGRIVRFVDIPTGTVVRGFAYSSPGNVEVEFDAYGSRGAHTSRLEPILPSGHRAAEESLEELLPFLKEQKVSA